MDLQLPQSARVNKFVAKTKFYERTKLNSRVQEAFTQKIQKITWKYKLAEETIGIAKTENVTEIQVFEIELKEQVIPQNVLKVIDKAIPYPILYIFVYQDNFVYGITLKDNSGLKSHYFSDWNQPVAFDFTGIDLEKVYQKLIKAFIANEAGSLQNFEAAVAMDAKIKNLEKDIAVLENKISAGKQFNRKVEFNKKLLAIKKELEILKLSSRKA